MSLNLIVHLCLLGADDETRKSADFDQQNRITFLIHSRQSLTTPFRTKSNDLNFCQNVENKLEKVMLTKGVKFIYLIRRGCRKFNLTKPKTNLNFVRITSAFIWFRLELKKGFGNAILMLKMHSSIHKLGMKVKLFSAQFNINAVVEIKWFYLTKYIYKHTNK